jgi:hypothetical protein
VKWSRKPVDSAEITGLAGRPYEIADQESTGISTWKL